MRKIFGICVVAGLSAALSGCGSESPDLQSAGSFEGDGGLLGVPAGADAPDMSCQIVLRSVARVAGEGGGYATNCVDGQCWFVWQGTLALSSAAADAGQPAVMYRSTSDSTWHEAPAIEVIAGTPGRHEYSFVLDRYTVTDGTSMTTLMRTVIDVIPVLKMSDGSRLFDHNRNPGALDNYVLDATNNWSIADDPAVCVRPRATLRFLSDWNEEQRGAIVAGGALVLDYDLARLPQCVNSYYNGSPSWGTTAYARFLPSGEIKSGPVSQYTYGDLGMTVGPALLTLDVPAGAQRVELWFAVSGYSCNTTWDSNYGANYSFNIASTPTAARVGWAGDWASMVSRGCMASDRQNSVPEPFVLDSWALTRATCLYIEADVWVPGITDASQQHPELIVAEAVLSRDGAPEQTAWLSFQGRVGNNYRYRLDLWKAGIDYIYTPWDAVTYALRFSTNGVTNYTIAQSGGPDGGAKRTIVRGADWCPATYWGTERCPQ